MTGGGSQELRRRFLLFARIVFGYSLLLVGVVGLFVPVLQGIAFIIAGLTVLAADLPWAKRLLLALRERLRRGREPEDKGRGTPPASEGGVHDAQHRDQTG